MDGFVLIVVAVAVAMFLAGLFLGKQLASNRFQSRQPAQAPAPDRAALALAWQRGFDSATQEEARKRETGDALGPQDSPTETSGPVPGEHRTSVAVSLQHGPAPFNPAPFNPAPSGPAAAVGPPGPGSGQPQFAGAMPVVAHEGQSTMPPPPPRVPVVPVDPRVRALRNINITLYVAALLMVAAASLFIALALPAAAKVVGLGLVAAGFYGVGLLMHARSVRLRPAAAAFTATGLALIPMTGLAHFLLLSTTPGASWFVTSVVGTVAFAYAAGKLQSRIVAGLGTTFLVSTAYSGGAVLNRGLIYYFLFSMLLATAITLVGARKPRWVGNIHVQSFALAHRYLVPATVLAALLSFAVLEAKDYGWIFAAAALYYAVALIAAPAVERFAHLAAARISAMASIGAFLHVADISATDIFRIMAALLVAQLVLLAQFAPGYAGKLRLKQVSVTGETWVLLALAGLAAMIGAESLLRDPGFAGSRGGLELNWALALLLVAGVFVGTRLGGNFRWVPLGVAVLGIVEPMDGNQGRQGIMLAAAALTTWWLARNASGTGRSSLRWAARIASIPATGALFSYAAAGWALQPRFGSTLMVLPGTASPARSSALEHTIEVATLVGVVLALLIQLCVAAALLSRMRRSTQAATAPRLESFGESLIFAGGVLCTAVATWSLSVKLGWGDSLLYADVDPGTAGFATVLWLGYQWDTFLLWLGLLAGLVGATAILGHRRALHRTPGERTGAVLDRVPLALAHLGGLAALGAGLGMAAGRDPAWMVELVAVLGLAHAGIRILAGTGLAEKVGYSVLAQALFSGTAWHVADRFDMDGHGQFALFAFTIALAQSVRAAVGRTSAMPKYSDPRTLMTLAAVVLLMLIPAVYLMSHAGGYDQAGLLVQFLCLLAFSGVVVTTHVRRAPALRYVAVPAALGLLGLVLVPALGQSLRFGGWLPTPLWNKDVAGTVLVLLLLGILVAEVRNLAGKDWRWVRAVVAVAYWVVLFGLHDWQEPGWQVVAGLLGAAGFMVFSATWGIPLLLLGSSALVLLASLRGVDFIHNLALERGSEPLDSMIGLGATWVILLIASIFGDRFGGEPVPFSAVVRRAAGWAPAHARVLFSASLAALGLGGLLGQTNDIDRHVYAGAVMLLVAVFAAAALEVPARLRESGYEVAALVGAAVIHRCWWVGVGGTSTFAAFYYWIIVLGLLAAYEFRRKRERNGIVVLGASSVLLSMAGLGTFLSSTLAQQLVVLLTFTALLVFGLVTNRKIFTVWGAVGVAVAVLWFLRGYTFLLLLLIAAGLIALALWRLGKMNKGSQDHDSPSHPYPPAAVPAARQAPAAGQSEPDQTVYGPTGPQGPASPPAGSGMPWMRPHGHDASDD